MNNNNFLFLIRLWVARFPSWYYFLSTILLIIIGLFALTVSFDDDDNAGSVINELTTVPLEILLIIGGFAATGAGMTIAFNFLKSHFTAGAPREQTLSLPVSKSDHLSALYIVVLLVIPMLVFLPILLIGIAFCTLHPENWLMPHPTGLFPKVFSIILPYLLLVPTILYPGMALTKRAGLVTGIAIVGFFATLGILTERMLSSPETSGHVTVELPQNYYTDADVVGLNTYDLDNTTVSATPSIRVRNDKTPNAAMITVAISGILFLLASWTSFSYLKA